MYFEYDRMFHYLLASLRRAESLRMARTAFALDGDITGDCILLFHPDDVSSDVLLQKNLRQAIPRFPLTSDDDVDFLLNLKVLILLILLR
jgi:hypothetical protein